MAQAARRAEEERPSFSGRLLLRMPPALHAEVSRKAELERVSLNQFITTAVASAVGWNGDGEGTDAQPQRISRRTLAIALAANLIVVGIAGAVALALLVAAWRDGF
jgi:HicB family